MEWDASMSELSFSPRSRKVWRCIRIRYDPPAEGRMRVGMRRETGLFHVPPSCTVLEGRGIGAGSWVVMSVVISILQV
jgi:hypothetical protein